MGGGDDDTASGATVGGRPSRIEPATVQERALDRGAGRGDPAGVREATARAATGAPWTMPSAATALTTAADALRNEELERTRQFIRIGWAISIATLASVPVLRGPRVMTIALIVALTSGVVISAWFHRAFAEPRRYTPRALITLALVCLVNAQVAVLYFGTFTATSLIIVIGIHFVARTEAERAARWIFASAVGLFALCALAITSGAIRDPGVFASDRPVATRTHLAGAGFVLGTYVLAYVTARSFRRASLGSIESLRKATRVASQRDALMDELRLDLEHALRVGGPGRYSEQLVGDYRLGAMLGRGAMGEVYDAVQLSTGAPAAVKLLRRELLTDPTTVARFLREARAAGALASPHVVKLIEAAERDPPFLAMERLHGHTLAERLRIEGRLSLTALAGLVREVGDGLDAAAGAGIVHRDIKPQNLFHDRVWKILDFGVATLAGDRTGSLTQGDVIGTPSYMAPEQAQAKRVDGRTDLYALAAVAYRCVTGRHPFSGASAPALLYAAVHKMPPRPGAASQLPPDVDRWFALALAKRPDDRFATGRALADALDAAIASALDPRLRKRADAIVRALPWA
jgi:eukaryotic-like serine/threonine-protein kinase